MTWQSALEQSVSLFTVKLYYWQLFYSLWQGFH